MQTAVSSIYAAQFPVVNMLQSARAGHIRTNILVITLFIGEYYT